MKAATYGGHRGLVRIGIAFHGTQPKIHLSCHSVPGSSWFCRRARCRPGRPTGCGGLRARRTVPPLPANAEQVAREIGVLSLVERVRVLAPTCVPAGSLSLEELSLRQQITEAVLAASLDVHDVFAEINYEQAQITELQDRLSSAKSNKVNTLTLAGILVGSGSSRIGTGMGLNNSTAKAGDWVQVVWRCGRHYSVDFGAERARRNRLPGTRSQHARPYVRTRAGEEQRLSSRRLDISEHCSGGQPKSAGAVEGTVNRRVGAGWQNRPHLGLS